MVGRWVGCCFRLFGFHQGYVEMDGKWGFTYLKSRDLEFGWDPVPFLGGVFLLLVQIVMEVDFSFIEFIGHSVPS